MQQTLGVAMSEQIEPEQMPDQRLWARTGPSHLRKIGREEKIAIFDERTIESGNPSAGSMTCRGPMSSSAGIGKKIAKFDGQTIESGN